MKVCAIFLLTNSVLYDIIKENRKTMQAEEEVLIETEEAIKRHADLWSDAKGPWQPAVIRELIREAAGKIAVYRIQRAIDSAR